MPNGGGGGGSGYSVDDVSSPSARLRSSAPLGLCVSDQVRCDGLVNCPDGRDESAGLCKLFNGYYLNVHFLSISCGY